MRNENLQVIKVTLAVITPRSTQYLLCIGMITLLLPHFHRRSTTRTDASIKRSEVAVGHQDCSGREVVDHESAEECWRGEEKFGTEVVTGEFRREQRDAVEQRDLQRQSGVLMKKRPLFQLTQPAIISPFAPLPTEPVEPFIKGQPTSFASCVEADCDREWMLYVRKRSALLPDRTGPS